MADASLLKRAAYRLCDRLGPAAGAEADARAARAGGSRARRRGGRARAAARCATSSASAASSAAVCGAAPIAPQVLEFFWALGVPVHEGYGQTENTAVGHAARRSTTCGSARSGAPLAGRRGADRRRRRDPHPLARPCSLGYFKDDDATAATIDADGWLHTGDVGELDERRLPHDHRPQEGHHHHRRRQERLAVGDREPAEGVAVRARGDRDRRPPQVPGRADRHRARHGRRLGRAPRPRVHHLRRPLAQARGAGADRRVGRARSTATSRRSRRSSASRCSRRSSTTRTASSPRR